MSYRSFKRVLGETSLERKLRYLFGACLLLLISGSFFAYYSQTSGLVYRLSTEKAAQYLRHELITLHWTEMAKDEVRKAKEHRGEEVRTSGDSVDELWVEAIPSITSELQKNIDDEPDNKTKKPNYTASFIRPQGVDSKGNSLTAQDQRALALLRDDPTIKFHEEFIDNRSQYVYYRPIRWNSSCIVCHNNNHTGGELGLLEASREPENGDLFSVAKIQLPNEYLQTELNRNRAVLIAFAIITTFLAMLASWAIVRYIIAKPLAHLRDVSDAVSRGAIDTRSDIHTGDEFEELGEAFNRMLRHLMEAQQELRNVNGNLDAKVDELAQANMQLFEMNRLKSDFLATMSHELRTPLNSIIGFSDVLGAIKSLDDKQRRYVLNIQKSGKMLLDMINDILDLAKIESGKMAVRLTDFPIEHVIGSLCDMARPLTEKKNIDLEIEIEPRLPELHQDQSKVQQILNNLLSNAIKFTPEGGRIVVSAKRSAGDYLLLTVTDTGVGIADEDQSQIFEKFRQGHTVLPDGSAMTREYSGTGLGLSIVKELCKLLGGEISLTSELGKGSAFMVRLPWHAASPVRLDSELADELQDLTKPRRVEFDRVASASPTFD